MLNVICVYAGSSDKVHPEYLEAARWMGHTIAERGIAIAYGAGSTGLMGALADSALSVGGEVVGLLNAMNYFDPLLALVEHARREGFLYDEHR